MKRKVVALFLASVMLTGCGTVSVDTQSLPETAESEVNTSEADVEEKELPEIVETSEAIQSEVTESVAVVVESSETVDAPGMRETDSATEEISENVNLVMVGDILLHTNIHESGKCPDGTYNYDHLFANVKEEIEGADLALVNQEVILGGTELGLSGYPAFNGAYEVGDSLVDAGFDVILHATNHALDKGKKGLLNCINFWRENYPEIGVVGIYDSEEAQDAVYVREINGIRIAILNYTYGTNGISLPKGMPYAVNYLDEGQVRDEIRRAEELADFTIVCPHWGTEYHHEQSSSQEKWASIFAEEGADLVIGTHPHVIQPIEWVRTEAGHEMLVYYSIGNFINSTSGTGAGVADRMCGGMAQVTLSRQEDGQVAIEEYGVEPLVTQMLTGTGRITTYKFSEYTPELAAENEIRKQDPAFSYEYCAEVFKCFEAQE